jgi:Concanavalin A-like lectin/glucanases superfamily
MFPASSESNRLLRGVALLVALATPMPSGNELMAQGPGAEGVGRSVDLIVTEQAPVDTAADSGEAEELELAQQLLSAQELVAELKRCDFTESGMRDIVRPQFAEALKQYERLREEVLRRRAARARVELPKTAQPNYELQFNGQTSYVELPTLKYDGEIPYTIEAIISPTPISGYRINPETHSYAHSMAIVTDTEFGGVELGLTPAGISIDLNSESQGWYTKAKKPCLPFLETRMHVAAVIEDAEIRLYRNGELVASQPFEGPVGTSPFTMRIGCSPHPVTEFHEMFCGQIDEVRISNSARYTDDFEPQSRLEADDDTEALYHFDEGQGDVLRDASGNRHHGIIHDARWVRVGE